MNIFGTVTMQERADFAKNLSVMLRSGIPVDEALEILKTQTVSSTLSRAVKSLRSDIQHGSLLSHAFKEQRTTFGQLFVHLVAAGEQSGTLSENLEFLAQWFERSADLRREVSAATLYPKLVFGASLVLGLALGVFILPRLVPLFQQLDAELPLITELILAASVFIQDWWPWCIAAAIAAYTGVRLLLHLPALRLGMDTVKLTLPFVGRMFRNYQLALISQLFATLLRSGVSITTATGIVTESIPNLRYRASLVRAGERLLEGRPVSTALEEYPRLYPKMLLGIVTVGERSGTLSDSFTYLSGYYTKEVRANAKQLPTIIEPVLLIFIAAVVGVVALAIILPIYEITGSITR